MEKYFHKASTSKQKETAQQKPKRKYKEDYVQHGFIASGPENNQQPFCIICNKALSNESVVPSKLSRHLEKNHPTLQDKPKEYFVNLKSQKNKQGKILNSYLKLPEKGLIASSKVAHLLAKRKKAHTDAESVIGPTIVVEEMLGTAAAEKVRGVPLSNNTISRRIKEPSSDLKDQVREHFVAIDNELCVLWSLQVDESTDRTGKSHLLAFISFINNETLVNEFLFCK